MLTKNKLSHKWWVAGKVCNFCCSNSSVREGRETDQDSKV